MGTPYVGEIRMFAGNFAPVGWAFCDGRLLPISENETLFNLIGTTYGGDGQSTFALPDLRGRLPVHQANGFTIGQMGGVEEVTVVPGQIPVNAHTHALAVLSIKGDSTTPTNGILAPVPGETMYSATASPDTALAESCIAPANSTGGTAASAHTNMQPYLCVDFIISLFGIFPSQT